MPSFDYRRLPVGHEFPRCTFQVDSRMIESYSKAVEEPKAALREFGAVPPMAVAGAALGALAEQVDFPFGSIHLTQELDFRAPVKREEVLSCRGKLLKRKDRRGFHLLTIGVDVYNQHEQLVMAGKTGFVLPRPEDPGTAEHRTGKPGGPEGSEA